MFVSYLIDPSRNAVEPVKDGFDKAPSLLATDRLDVTALWTGSFDPDSSVEMIVADEATLDEATSETSFTYRFTCHGRTRSRRFTGKGILVAVGDVLTILLDNSTLEAVAAAVSCPPETRSAFADVVHWSAHPVMEGRSAPVRRGPRRGETSKSGTNNK